MKVWIDRDQCIGNGICEESRACARRARVGAPTVIDDGQLLPSGPTGGPRWRPRWRTPCSRPPRLGPGECIIIDID